MFCLETFGQILFHSIIINVTSDGKEYMRALTHMVVGSRSRARSGRRRAGRGSEIELARAQDRMQLRHITTRPEAMKRRGKRVVKSITNLPYARRLQNFVPGFSLILAPLVLYAFATLLGRLDTTTTTNTEYILTYICKDTTITK